MASNSVAPPPPPPPPPMDHSPNTNAFKPVANGDLNNGSAGGGKLITPQKLTQQKKILPTIDDTRNDLLKAIRDGKNLDQSKKLIFVANKTEYANDVFIFFFCRYQIEKSGKDRAKGEGTFDRIPRCCIDIGTACCN